jgi:hypothetical protein
MLAFGRTFLDQIVKAGAYGVVDQLKSLMHGTASGNGRVRGGNEIKILKSGKEDSIVRE